MIEKSKYAAMSRGFHEARSLTQKNEENAEVRHGEDDGPELARRIRSSVSTAEEALAEPNAEL